jgi:hypothetical protein
MVRGGVEEAMGRGVRVRGGRTPSAAPRKYGCCMLSYGCICLLRVHPGRGYTGLSREIRGILKHYVHSSEGKSNNVAKVLQNPEGYLT